MLINNEINKRQSHNKEQSQDHGRKKNKMSNFQTKGNLRKRNLNWFLNILFKSKDKHFVLLVSMVKPLFRVFFIINIY